MSVKRNKWVIFCSVEWPSFNVGWPTGGTFDSETIDRLARIVYHLSPGHADQIPYIATWRGLIDKEGGPYPWVKAFLSPYDLRAYVLATKTGNFSRVKEAKVEPLVFQEERNP